MKLTRKEYTTPEEKKKDFWRGFGLWWGINVVMLVMFVASAMATSTLYSPADGTISSLDPGFAIVLNLLPWLVNLGLLIFLAQTRSQMALGALVAFGVAGAIAVILGIFAAVACFFLLFSTGN